MSKGLKEVSSEKMKVFLQRFTKNIFLGILTGTIVTTLLDSSSATIVMVIALVNAGVLTFRQSMGVILGSNIGTTIGCQIFAYDIGEYSFLPLAIGILILLMSKTTLKKNIGKSTIGLGLIFSGMYLMGISVEPLKNYEPIIAYLTKMEGPLWGTLAGGIFTLIIQSSSAMLGIVISLARQGLITLPAATAIMFGAEIGTCFDTLVASIGRTRDALRAGLFHLIFNIVTVSLGVLMIKPFIRLVEIISLNADLDRKVANAHVLFNLFGVVLFLFLTPFVEKILHTVILNKPNSHSKLN
jgi:phosphate:Na+ symporter